MAETQNPIGRTPAESQHQPGSTKELVLFLSGRQPYQPAGTPVHDPDLIDEAIWSRVIECSCRGGPWPLVFTGGVGTGKTCAALCLLDQVKSRQYQTVGSLCEELIAVFDGQREYGQRTDNVTAWWRRWGEADCVVLDELAARDRVSDFHYDTVKRAIDRRIDMPSVFISNLGLDDISKVYDDRIASRLVAGTLIRFDGDDRRLA